MLILPANQLLDSDGYPLQTTTSFSIYSEQGEVEDFFSYGSALEIRYTDGLLVNPAPLDTPILLSESQLFDSEVQHHLNRWREEQHNAPTRHDCIDFSAAHSLSLLFGREIYATRLF